MTSFIMDDSRQYVIEEVDDGSTGIKDERVVELEEENVVGNVISQYMRIEQPLSVLREALEERLGMNLRGYDFFLQDTLKLESFRTLADQCVQAEGLVQINLELNTAVSPDSRPRINIMDILKPSDSELAALEASGAFAPSGPTAPAASGEDVVLITQDTPSVDTDVTVENENRDVTRWGVDPHYKKLMEMNGIPADPASWNEAQVQMWLRWAAKHFGNQSVEPDYWEGVDGQRLVSLTHQEFRQLVPVDRGDHLWTHFELLRRYKFVAVMQNGQQQSASSTDTGSVPVNYLGGGFGRVVTTDNVPTRLPSRYGVGLNYRNDRASEMIIPTPASLRSGPAGTSGQVQLWQFLLELLTDWHFRDIIHWVSEDGEFKLNNPETVAQLWGQRKNKPAMNYEKLSRALRYYYDGDMIAKVHGKRFVYKFICDLKTLLGYSAGELHYLVNFCAAKHTKGKRRKHQHSFAMMSVPGSMDFTGYLTAGGSARTTDKDRLYLKQFELPPSTNYPITVGDYVHGVDGSNLLQ